MTAIECPGLPASWTNAWLAAIGTTVLDDRIRLGWTESSSPVAVLSCETDDPLEVLVNSWPDDSFLAGLPIAEQWGHESKLQRKVPVEAFAARAKEARTHPFSWTLTSTMTDLCVDERGEVSHAPFDPAGPGTTRWLHHRLVKVHRHVEASPERLNQTLIGTAERVLDNGLGFDQTRLGSMADATGKWVDPVIEVLAFFGLALLPVRGDGEDKRINRRARISVRQKGWHRLDPASQSRSFSWPAWIQALDRNGIDALLDYWNPRRKPNWSLLGVHAGWRSSVFQPSGSSDTTRAIGSERL